MKKETMRKRLEKLNLNKNSRVYKTLDHIAFFGCSKNDQFFGGDPNSVIVYDRGEITIFPKKTKGWKKYGQALDKLKIKYITGNNAPRGGVYGNFIKLITKIY